MSKKNLLDNVWMFKTLKKWNFTDCSGWHTVVLFFKSDLFQSDGLTGDLVNCLINDTIRSFTKFVKLLIPVDLRGRLDELLLLSLWLLGTWSLLTWRDHTRWRLLSTNILGLKRLSISWSLWLGAQACCCVLIGVCVFHDFFYDERIYIVVDEFFSSSLFL